MTSTSGILIGPLHKPACVHLLHCSKKHFPFSVVSLTQKEKNTHILPLLYSKLTPSLSSMETLAAVHIQVEGVRTSLGFKMLHFFMNAFHHLGWTGF